VTHIALTSRLVALALSALIVTAACASLPPESGSVTATVGPDGVQRVEIQVANEMRFAPSSIVVTAGKPIEITLHSIAQQRHDFTLTEGVTSPVSVVVSGGQTASATFTITSPGSYHFICAQQGHADGGMRGTIVVQ
jgi:uncharacterized cupredoxin-like copper-binding protein